MQTQKPAANTQMQYHIEQEIGNGTFGKATVLNSDEKVAIKKVFQDKRYKNREHQMIKELNHPNIVRLKHAYYTQGPESRDDVYLNLVMEYVPETLSRVIRTYRKSKTTFPNVQIKIYSYQMFRSLAYLLGINICHRDIKPQNILVNPLTLQLKICDFGSAKRLIKGEDSVAYICSRYYRAPELIFGATQYTNAIDVWSIGCVIAEMVLGEPLFPGESAVDQLVEIIKILGTPTMEQVKQMNPNHQEFKFPQIKAHPWSKVQLKFNKKVFQRFKTDPQLVDLLSKLLVYNPLERPKPLEILMHPYFNDIRTENFKTQSQQMPDFFNFTPDEVATNPELILKLTPSWYQRSPSSTKEISQGGSQLTQQTFKKLDTTNNKKI